MNVKELDRIQKHMNDILKNRESRINDLKQEIDNQKENKVLAEKMLEESTDVDTYKEAKHQIQHAEETIEFCNYEIWRLESRKDVSAEDIKGIKASLESLQKESNKGFDNAAGKIVDDLRTLVDEYRKINGSLDNMRNTLCNYVAVGESKTPMKAEVSWMFDRLDRMMANLDNAIKYKDA